MTPWLILSRDCQAKQFYDDWKVNRPAMLARIRVLYKLGFKPSEIGIRLIDQGVIPKLARQAELIIAWWTG